MLQISYLLEPGGIGIRCDSGIIAGGFVYPYYDPLLSKLIVWAETRPEAIARMTRALKEYMIFGVETTIPFFIRLLRNEAFCTGNISTNFLEDETQKPTKSVKIERLKKSITRKIMKKREVSIVFPPILIKLIFPIK